MQLKRLSIIGLAGLLASGLMAAHPVRSQAQRADGSAYTLTFRGTADFTTTTGSGPLAGSTTHFHGEWSATGDGSEPSTRGFDAGLIYDDDTFLTFTVLQGTYSVKTVGFARPGDTRECSTTLSPKPDARLVYGKDAAAHDDTDSEGFGMGFKFDFPFYNYTYVQGDNTTDPNCFVPSTGRMGFPIENLPTISPGQYSVLESALAPIVDFADFDPSQAYDRASSPDDWDYTGPFRDPNGPTGTTIYEGHIHQSVELTSYGPS